MIVHARVLDYKLHDTMHSYSAFFLYTNTLSHIHSCSESPVNLTVSLTLFLLHIVPSVS